MLTTKKLEQSKHHWPSVEDLEQIKKELHSDESICTEICDNLLSPSGNSWQVCLWSRELKINTSSPSAKKECVLEKFKGSESDTSTQCRHINTLMQHISRCGED
jgi:hypothetical protein